MGCRYDNSTGIFHNYRVPERGRKKIMNEHRHAQRDDSLPLSTLAALPRFYRAVYLYTYPAAASLTRTMFAGKTRARQRRAYTSSSRPSKFSRGRQVRGPSAAKSFRESARVARR